MSRWVWEVGDIFIIRRLRQCRYPPGQPRERDAPLPIDATHRSHWGESEG